MSDAAAAVRAGAPIPSVDKGFGAIDSDGFTKLILTELANQDPLEPNDTSALLQQLATIRSIESDTKLNATLAAMTDRTDFMGAAGLIGQRVTSADNQVTPQKVISVVQDASGVSVKLEDGTFVPIGSILSIFGADEPAETVAEAGV